MGRSWKAFWYGTQRRKFWPKREELKWDIKKMHIEECHNLHSSPNIIIIIKSIRIEIAGHSVHEKNIQNFPLITCREQLT
jgi:hypothetical protein